MGMKTLCETSLHTFPQIIIETRGDSPCPAVKDESKQPVSNHLTITEPQWSSGSPSPTFSMNSGKQYFPVASLHPYSAVKKKTMRSHSISPRPRIDSLDVPRDEFVTWKSPLSSSRKTMSPMNSSNTSSSFICQLSQNCSRAVSPAGSNLINPSPKIKDRRSFSQPSDCSCVDQCCNGKLPTDWSIREDELSELNHSKCLCGSPPSYRCMCGTENTSNSISRKYSLNISFMDSRARSSTNSSAYDFESAVSQQLPKLPSHFSQNHADLHNLGKNNNMRSLSMSDLTEVQGLQDRKMSLPTNRKRLASRRSSSKSHRRKKSTNTSIKYPSNYFGVIEVSPSILSGSCNTSSTNNFNRRMSVVSGKKRLSSLSGCSSQRCECMNICGQSPNSLHCRGTAHTCSNTGLVELSELSETAHCSRKPSVVQKQDQKMINGKLYSPKLINGELYHYGRENEASNKEKPLPKTTQPQREMKRSVPFCRLMVLLVGMQILDGSTMSSLGWWLYKKDFGLRCEECAFWAAIPLLFCGLISSIFCMPKYMSLRDHRRIKVLQLSVAVFSLVCAVLCFVSSVFAGLLSDEIVRSHAGHKAQDQTISLGNGTMECKLLNRTFKQKCNYVFVTLNDYLILQCALMGTGGGVCLWLTVTLIRNYLGHVIDDIDEWYKFKDATLMQTVRLFEYPALCSNDLEMNTASHSSGESSLPQGDDRSVKSSSARSKRFQSLDTVSYKCERLSQRKPIPSSPQYPMMHKRSIP